MSYGLDDQGERSRDLHLVSRLRMSGAIPQLPLHVLMAWAGKTLRSYKIKGSHTT
jgi:hypothetical protein